MTNPNPDISDKDIQARAAEFGGSSTADMLLAILADRTALRDALTEAEEEREELRGLLNANEDAEREFNLNAYAQLAARDATIAELRAALVEARGVLASWNILDNGPSLLARIDAALEASEPPK